MAITTPKSHQAQCDQEPNPRIIFHMWCEVPIVFVTAQSDEDTVERIHEQVPGHPYC
jgi:hypothetical protein